MTTLAVPKRMLGNDDLILMPRREYEVLLRAAKKYAAKPLDQDLLKALREVDAGETIGPFRSVKELEVSLEQ